MSIVGQTVKPPPVRAQVFPALPTSPRPVRSGVGAWVMGVIFLVGFGFVLASERHRIWSSATQRQQSWSAPVVVPGPTASGGWSPITPPVNQPATQSVPSSPVQVIPVVPAYQTPPPTVYRVEPITPYRPVPVPERPYSRDHGR